MTYPLREMNMNTGKQFWLDDPNPDQTSVRFCCPICFNWVRNREFEEHMKLAHPQMDSQSVKSEGQPEGGRGQGTR